MKLVGYKTALLQMLISGQGYSLELMERFETSTGGQEKLLQGRVSPALRDLELEGLVKSWDGEPLPERGGRPRRYYELTAEGKRVAQQERQLLRGVVGLTPAWEAV